MTTKLSWNVTLGNSKALESVLTPETSFRTSLTESLQNKKKFDEESSKKGGRRGR